MSNSIVAVAIVVIALSLVIIDLRENILKKTFCISIVLLGMGVCATLSNINFILGLIINLGVIFFIVYEGANTYKESMYFPFLLGYIFMEMSAPATLSELPMRLLAIFVGCIYIIIIQLILNKGRFEKTILGMKQGIITTTIKKIDCIISEDYKSFSREEIYPFAQKMVKAIYDNRLIGKVMPSKNKGRVALVLAVEELYAQLGKLSDKKVIESYEIEFLNEVKTLLNEVDKYLGCPKNNGNRKRILDIIENLNGKAKTTILKDIAEILVEIPYALELIEVEEEKISNISYLKSFFKPIKTDSFSFKFAIKLSVTVSSIILITEVFNITYGRWIIFPLIAIIQPSIEGTMKKSLERILGTIIGIIIFVVIFSVVKDNMIRLNITILLAYINLFVKKYYISTSLIAVSALGSVAMGGAGSEILLFRIVFTIIGCGIGLLVNKYVFYYNSELYRKELLNEYNEHIYHLENSNLCEVKRYDTMLKSKLLQYKIVSN